MNSPTNQANKHHPITEALATLVRGICYHPDELSVCENFSVTGALLKIDFEAHSADAPIIIGRLGRQAKAIKFIAEQMGERAGVKVDVQVRDSYRGLRESYREFTPNPKFTNADFFLALEPVLELVFGKVPPLEWRDEADSTALVLDLAKEHSTIAQAIANAFYPFAIRHGRKIRILNKNYAKMPSPEY